MSSVEIRPATGALDAVVPVPGSKSVANRALLCAALVPGDGTSVLHNVPGGDDCVAMVAALEAAGAHHRGEVRGGRFPGDAVRLDAGLAGTTSRFLTAAAVLSDRPVVVDGGEPLRRRPMADLHDALRALGADVVPAGTLAGHLPVSVSAGHVRGGRVAVKGDVSSQFVSALMLVAPRLAGGLMIEVDGDLVSRPYVEMTATVMRAFGADVDITGALITVGTAPYSAREYTVEPDFSSAAFPIMALAARPGRVRIPSLVHATMQGDSRILDIARAMGMQVESGADDVTVSRPDGSVLSAVTLDMRDCSDLVPAVAVACTSIAGTSSITGVGFIRGKESDRLGDLAAELRSAGAVVDEHDDGLTITGGQSLAPQRPFATHHDHRLAMAFALVESEEPFRVDDADVVSKSWPSFFDDMSGVLGPVRFTN